MSLRASTRLAWGLGVAGKGAPGRAGAPGVSGPASWIHAIHHGLRVTRDESTPGPCDEPAPPDRCPDPSLPLLPHFTPGTIYPSRLGPPLLSGFHQPHHPDRSESESAQGSFPRRLHRGPGARSSTGPACLAPHGPLGLPRPGTPQVTAGRTHRGGGPPGASAWPPATCTPCRPQARSPYPRVHFSGPG